MPSGKRPVLLLSMLLRAGCGYENLLSVSPQDGLLRINLARMAPEALQPRRIAIAAAGDNDAKVERKNAA
jgi:hypothetical protein